MLYRKATNDSGDSQVIRARCEPAETALPNRSLMKNKKRSEGESGYSDITYLNFREEHRCHRQTMTDGHATTRKKERETSEHKKPGVEETFYQLRSVTIQRKIYPNDQAD